MRSFINVLRWLRGFGVRRKVKASRVRRSWRPVLEQLENRCVPAAVTWMGGPGAAGHDWNIAANWDTGTVPTKNDDVTINVNLTEVVDPAMPSCDVAAKVKAEAKTVTVNQVSCLNIEGSLQVSGNVVTTGEGLLLEVDP